MTSQAQSGPPGFLHTYGVELLFSGQPDFDEVVFRNALSGDLPDSQPTRVDGSGFMVAHTKDVVNFTDGAKPATTAVMSAKPGINNPRYKEYLGQTWEWRDEADARLAGCSHTVLITDLLSAQLAPRRRIELVHRVVRAACAASPVRLLAWHPAGKMVDPAKLDDLVAVSINARMFRDQSGSARLVMDTLGLSAIGLPDVQIDFEGLDPGRVAGWLYGVAEYLLDHGDVIEDGNTLTGPSTDARWTCQHQLALVAPERLVIDIDPGPEHSRRRRPT